MEDGLEKWEVEKIRGLLHKVVAVHILVEKGARSNSIDTLGKIAL